MYNVLKTKCYLNSKASFLSDSPSQKLTIKYTLNFIALADWITQSRMQSVSEKISRFKNFWKNTQSFQKAFSIFFYKS